MKKMILFLLLAICSVVGFSQETGTFNDPRDGKVYKTVKIGNQTWFAENLAYLPQVCISQDTCGYWIYDFQGNDKITAKATDNYKKYGVLYSWRVAQNVCTEGWHLPDIKEYETLLKNIGGKGKKAYKQLIIGGACGFNAVYSGFRERNKTFVKLDNDVAFWSRTQFMFSGSKNSTDAFYLGGFGDEHKVYVDFLCEKNYGFSVRCIKND
jgi:uncharacterized protein (TIGR02145 family)